jgi:hypothetical protein
MITINWKYNVYIATPTVFPIFNKFRFEVLSTKNFKLVKNNEIYPKLDMPVSQR